MIERGFSEPDSAIATEDWLHRKTVADLKLQTPLTVLPTVSCEKVRGPRSAARRWPLRRC
jgi:hypothetical protein